VFVCVCKSDFVITELLELIPLRGIAAGEYIFVREFTKKYMIIQLTELVCVVTDRALVMTNIEKCLVKMNEKLRSKIRNSVV
jgi:hypothetical protein